MPYFLILNGPYYFVILTPKAYLGCQKILAEFLRAEQPGGPPHLPRLTAVRSGPRRAVDTANLTVVRDVQDYVSSATSSALQL